MTGDRRKIYKNRSPAEIVLKILLALIIVLAVAAVILYFALKKYIVTDENGLHLEVPFLTAETENTAEPELIIEQ